MQNITGTRREVTIMLWREQIEKHMKRANDSMECFRRFSEADDLDHLIEDCEKIIENSKRAREAIVNMDVLGIN